MTHSVTVISTVLDEANTISDLLESLARQTRQADAVIIVDGGSTDGTIDVLHRWRTEKRLPLHVIEAAGTNIAQGRNVAIDAADTPIIAGTDAGTWLAPDWLENLMAPFERDPSVDVVAGFFVADPQTTFEVALGATTLPVSDDVNAGRFLPSSRSIAFRKSVWQALDGYPEWLDFCEDLLFDLWLRQDDYHVVFAPDAAAYFRPRRSLRQFFWQYYRYARGDGKADLWPLRHAVRYATYLIAGPLLLKLSMRSNLARLALLAGAILMFRPPLQRLWPRVRDWPWRRRLSALAWVPLIRVAGDVAKMLGYPVGRWWRRQHRRELRNVRGRPPFRLSQFFDRS